MRNCFYVAGLLLVAAGMAAAASLPRAKIGVGADPSTGRLVRKLIAPSIRWKAAEVRKHTGVDQMIEESATRHGVDPLLVHSVILAESNYNPFAISAKGAEGLMQLMPSTAARFAVTDSFDMRQNIDAGVKYLRILLDTFQDDTLAVAAYNAGEGAVIRYEGKVPPYRETQQYVKRVGETYESMKSEADRQEGVEPRYRPLESFVDAEGRLHLRTR